MLSLPFYLYLGIILIFASGIFYHPLMGIGAIEFGGGRMQMDIDYATDMSDIPKPDPYFYTNAILLASYGVPLLAMGIYFINKFRNNTVQVISIQKKLLVITATVFIIMAGMIGAAFLHNATTVYYYSELHHIGTLGILLPQESSFTDEDFYKLNSNADAVIIGAINGIGVATGFIVDDTINSKTITYNIKVIEELKGEYDDSKITIVKQPGDKFRLNDPVLVMLHKVNNEWTHIGGPYYMFKILHFDVPENYRSLDMEEYVVFSESSDQATVKPSSNTHPMWTRTDPSEFGTDDWLSNSPIQYTKSTNPFDIISESELIINGYIKQVISDEIEVHDNPDKNAPIEPPQRIIKYVIGIDKIIKGQYDSEFIEVVTIIDTKLDYLKDNDVYFMLQNVDGEWTPIAGPHAMFKIKDGFAIGDEKTLPLEEILKP